MRTLMTIAATLLTVALSSHLWLAFTGFPLLGGYLGFAAAVAGIALLAAMVVWLATPDRSETARRLARLRT